MYGSSQLHPKKKRVKCPSSKHCNTDGQQILDDSLQFERKHRDKTESVTRRCGCFRMQRHHCMLSQSQALTKVQRQPGTGGRAGRSHHQNQNGGLWCLLLKQNGGLLLANKSSVWWMRLSAYSWPFSLVCFGHYNYGKMNPAVFKSRY